MSNTDVDQAVAKLQKILVYCNNHKIQVVMVHDSITFKYQSNEQKAIHDPILLRMYNDKPV